MAWWMILCGSTWISGVAANDFVPEDIEFFEKQVRPLLVEKCQQCHGGKLQKGGLRLDSRAAVLKGGETGAAIQPGDVKASLLIDAINYDPDGYQMPPSGKLPPEQIALLTEWVRRNAPWPEGDETASVEKKFDLAERAKHWSFQPIRTSQIPAVRRRAWPRSSLDNYILSRLESAGLAPATDAEPASLLRRLSFELIGLPPTPEELADFLADDAPDAYERTVDRLLASPHYGERWARHWLDLVRFAETYGHEFDYEIRFPRPYRDYVIRAWNADVPYDQYVQEHIAGDLLPDKRRDSATGNLESVIGTAFWWFGQGKHSPVDIRAEECDTVDNQLDVFGKTFLGLTIACARCHDHKFDPISQHDYYALAGYLQSSRQTYADINPPEITRRLIDEIERINRDQQQAIVEQTCQRLERFSSQLADLLLGRGEFGPDFQEAWQKRLKDEAMPDARHPMHLWVHWSADPQKLPAQQAALPGQLRQFAEAAERARQNSAWLLSPAQAELAEDATKHWFAEGFAFDLRPKSGLTWLTQANWLRPVRGVVAPQTWIHSGIISPKLQGTLRSPTFTIEKPFIDVLASRHGGSPNPVRGDFKAGQVHLIVDGFQIIRSPLYGHLSIHVPQKEASSWYRIDASRFLGSRAYLEIDDPDDGEIVVEQMVMSDQSPPPRPFNELISRALSDEKLKTLEDVAAAYQTTVRELVATLRRQTANGAAGLPERDQPAAAELLNWLLREESLANPPADHADVATTIVEYAGRRRELESAIPTPVRTLAMAAGSPENDHLLIRGNHKKPGEETPRRFLEVFHAQHDAASSRRDLAELLVHGQNPLTPRVIVNRLWQHLFGAGLVSTPDDFGKMGQPPTNPELLDFLASDLIRGGWSLKRMQRTLVTSRTFRMSSRSTDAAAEEHDPLNRLWHRAHIQRLESEPIRDSLLLISGRLDDRLFGASVMPHLTDFMEGRGRPGASGALDGDGRRSLYINVRRNFLSPLFLAFDFPTPFTTMGRRSSSNVPAQALTLMNNPFVAQQADLWVKGLDPAQSLSDRIRQLYLSAYSRPPSDEEIAAAEEFLQLQAVEYGSPDDPRGWTDLGHVLLNVKEFVFIE